MRASVLVLAFAAAFVSAQASITDLPDCALECLTSSNFDGCSLDDQACLCKSQVFITSSTTCIRAGCSAEDDAKAAQITQQLCTQAGVTVAFTTSGAATATSVASASASSAISTSSGAAASTTAAHSSASAHSTSVAAATSSVAAGASATISQILGSASSAAASANTRPTGAAQANAVGAGAVFMGAVAAVAALAL